MALKGKDMKYILYNGRSYEILKQLNNNGSHLNIAKIARNIKMGVCYATKLVHQLKGFDLIYFQDEHEEARSRGRKTKLTDKGEQIKRHILEIDTILKEVEREKCPS